MKRVAIIDPASMAGYMVTTFLQENFNLVLVSPSHSRLDTLRQNTTLTPDCTDVVFDPLQLLAEYTAGFGGQAFGKHTQELFLHIGEVDAVVNCFTQTKPFLLSNTTLSYFVNASFPHILSSQYKQKLIHLSTDCVFDGHSTILPTESTQFHPSDFYGLTRGLGEPYAESMVIRTSTIGPEIVDFHSLVAWIKQQEGKVISGYTNHLWNGVTSKQFGKVVRTILANRSAFPKKGLFHIFGSDVSKYEMLCILANKYNVAVDIQPKSLTPIDRRIGTEKKLNGSLDIPTFAEMMAEL